MKKIAIFLILVTLVAGSLFAQRARDHIAQGREHIQAQRFEEAITSFEEVLRLEPRNRDAPALLNQAKEGRIRQLLTQGQALAREDKFLEAIEIYNLVLKIQADHREATNLIRQAQDGIARNRDNIIRQLITQGQVLTREGNFTEAIELYDQALQLESTDRSLVNNINNAKSEAQRGLQRAEQQAQERAARELAEQSRQTLRNANALFIENKFAEAIAAYENAVSMGGLNQQETQSAQRLITEAQEVLAKIESYKRPVRDDDFEVIQNTHISGGGITITGFKAFERKQINMGGRTHTVIIGITDVAIPERIYRLPVTSIANEAFSARNLSKVTIPNTVRAIGSIYFNNEHIAEFNIINSNYGGAFSRNPNLTEIVIPNSVTVIGDGTFVGCGLTRVTLGNRIQHIGDNAFRDNKISSITLPASLKIIGERAFFNNQLQSVTIPNGVETIVSNSFKNNPITELVIPASLAALQPYHGYRVSRFLSFSSYAFVYPPTSYDASFYSQYSPFPDTLTRVTLPANMDAHHMSVFELSLANFYIAQGRAAGVYVKNGPVWSRGR